MVSESVNGITKMSLNERFTLISERAEAPARAPRSNYQKPVIDNFIKMSNEIAHLKARALQQRRMQLQALQEQYMRLSLLQQLRRYQTIRVSVLPLAGTSAAAIPSRMPADIDRRQGVGWANTGRPRGLRAWQQATPARGQGMRGRGRGGIARQQRLHWRPVTREQLDAELDMYMASRPSAGPSLDP